MSDNKNNKYTIFKNQSFSLKFALYSLFVIICAILVFFIIFRFNDISEFLLGICKILEPIIYGLIIAYLINPIVKFFEKHIMTLAPEKYSTRKNLKKIARAVSITIALLLSLSVIYILGNMVIPELYRSIYGLAKNMPEIIDNFSNWGANVVSSDSVMSDYFETAVTKASGYLQNWLEGDFLPQLNSMVTYFTSGIIGFMKTLLNILIGIIISIYVLASKEIFTGQFKKITYALLKPQYANVFLTTVRKSNDIFGGFITGKIIDSFIIGVLCFIGLSILKMPYVVLVSVIVGVTNIIPFFGPYIGAIPSTILILITSPIQGLYFILFILVLQQLDGNVIGPKILGDSTGLSAFWVVFAILLGGGLFGIVGMIIGVPAFAVIYYILKQIIDYLLYKKGLTTCSAEYTNLQAIEDSGEFRYMENEVDKTNDTTDEDEDKQD